MSIFNEPIAAGGSTSVLSLTATSDQIVTSSSTATPGILSIPTPGQTTEYVFDDPGVASTDVILGNSTAGQTIIGGLMVDSITWIAGTPLIGYSSGTWTPALLTAVPGSGVTFTSSGVYVRIGEMVWVQFNVTCTALGTGTGQFLLSSLPYGVDTPGGTTYSPITILAGITLSGTDASLWGQINNASGIMTFVSTRSAGTPTSITTTSGTFGATTAFQGSAFYYTIEPF